MPKTLKPQGPLTDGTVVRFKKRFRPGGPLYDYVAIYAAKPRRWYTSGQDEDMKVLTHPPSHGA